MDWNLFGALAIAVFLIRWDQKKLTIISLCKELTILGLFIFLLSKYLEKSSITLSVFSHIPEHMEVWFAATVMASFVLYLSFKGWQFLHTSNSNHKHE